MSHPPYFLRYAAFCCLTMLVALVISSGMLAAGSSNLFWSAELWRNFAGAAIGTLFFGWFVWGPILIVALIPGHFLFVFISLQVARLNRGRVPPNLVAAISVSLATGLVFWGSLQFFSGGAFPLKFLAMLLCAGVPAAILSATLILIKCEDA